MGELFPTGEREMYLVRKDWTRCFPNLGRVTTITETAETERQVAEMERRYDVVSYTDGAVKNPSVFATMKGGRRLVHNLPGRRVRISRMCPDAGCPQYGRRAEGSGWSSEWGAKMGRGQCE